ncbi:unnamed protein product [Cylicocyclus nassatus]|uniref:Uncharacterized protein n=1 Tax=Cylicocyclus nassatus TaxID=53992 RepID=A0AA36GRA8_CYLNA|nr:unnamed protein product [Cylicocyclus nassatus]
MYFSICGSSVAIPHMLAIYDAVETLCTAEFDKFEEKNFLEDILVAMVRSHGGQHWKIRRRNRTYHENLDEYRVTFHNYLIRNHENLVDLSRQFSVHIEDCEKAPLPYNNHFNFWIGGQVFEDAKGESVVSVSCQAYLSVWKHINNLGSGMPDHSDFMVTLCNTNWFDGKMGKYYWNPHFRE